MKKSLSLILAIMITVSSVFAFSLTANAQEATKYIYLSSAADFAKIAKNPEADFFVTKDIDFSGVTGYKAAKSFSGTINGNGHTVKNFTGDCLFAANNSGIIKNFVFDNNTSESGIACAYNFGIIENIVMNNCGYFLVGENSFDDEFVGPDEGIIRYCVTNNCKKPICIDNIGRIIGCINNSDFSAKGCVGGIALINEGGDFIECVNNGNITATSEAGGIFGAELYWGGFVKRCTNNGDISSETSATGMGYTDYITAYDCVNNGKITAPKAYGIAHNGNIKRCVNSGVVTGENAAYAIADDTDNSVYAPDDNMFVADCYYLDGTGAPSGSGGDTAVNDLTDKTSFSALDFDKIWQISDTVSLKCTNTKTIGIAVKTLPKTTTGFNPEYDWFAGTYTDDIEIIAFNNKGEQFKPDYYDLSGGYFRGEGLHRITVSYDCFMADFNISTAKFPKQVTNLKAKTVTKTSVTLTWKKVTDAKRYNVQQYNAKTKKWKTVKTVKKNTAKITNLKKNKSYKFRVRAEKKVHDYCDCYGKYSKALTVKTKK